MFGGDSFNVAGEHRAGERSSGTVTMTSSGRVSYDVDSWDVTTGKRTAATNSVLGDMMSWRAPGKNPLMAIKLGNCAATIRDRKTGTEELAQMLDDLAAKLQ
jgi:hypothetical protein